MIDPFIQALKTVVRSQQHLTVGSKNVVHLKEKSPTTLNLLRISTLGCGDTFAFTLDVRKGGAHVPLSNHTSKATTAKWNKVCDGIFVWRATDGTLQILICDLKSSNPTGSEWKHQLWSSGCFVEYLLNVTGRFHELPAEPPAKFHAMAFHGGPAILGSGKRTTGVGLSNRFPKTTLDEPGKLLVINEEWLPLQALCK
jgi:hypothetical protein